MDRPDDELDELDGVADELLLAVPPVDPPAGFEDRVLARVEAARRSRGLTATKPGRRPWWAAAAAAAVLVVVGLAGGVVLGRASKDGPGALRTVQLLSAAGAPVGDVSTFPGKQPWVVMRLEGDVPDGTYRCELEMDDGRTVPIGRLWVLNGHGGWGEQVDVDPARARFARVLDRTGAVVATARFS